MPTLTATAPAYLTDDQRWEAVRSRDSAADGHFVYAVISTGVYARPSAAARLPHRSNVRFFDDATAAEAAGFRPTRHTSGDRSAAAVRRADIVAAACRFIEQADTLPTLGQLAQSAGLSPAHFHRLFRSETGLTPKAFAAAHRARRVSGGLASNDSTVTDAIFDAGFSSSSRFYETARARLGMRATDLRKGGQGVTIKFAVGQAALGAILVAQSAKGICAILIGDDPDVLVRDLQDRFPSAELVGADTAFEQVVAQVVGFVERPHIGLNLPLDVRGTAFQERVWQALMEIPHGRTASYTDIAERLGVPKAVRAVAQACGANRLAVAIPCHRVVRRNGDLSGYRWGIERKRLLLETESMAVDEREGDRADRDGKP